MVKRGRHLIHAPERVENIRQRQAHVHAAVEKIQRIRFEHSACAPFADCQQFTAAFAQRQIEGQREHSEIEPVGNDDLREDRAVDNAQHKSCRQDRNVDDRHILEPKAVGQIEQEIRRQQRSRRRMKHRRIGDRCDDQKHHSQHPCALHRHRPGSDRPLAFCRMQAVLVAVADVVDDVDRRSRRAKRHKTQHTSAELGRLKELAAGDQRREHEQVFHIMMNAHQLEITGHQETPL